MFAHVLKMCIPTKWNAFMKNRIPKPENENNAKQM